MADRCEVAMNIHSDVLCQLLWKQNCSLTMHAWFSKLDSFIYNFIIDDGCSRKAQICMSGEKQTIN